MLSEQLTYDVNKKWCSHNYLFQGRKRLKKKLINAITFSNNINGLMLFVHTGKEGEKRI